MDANTRLQLREDRTHGDSRFPLVVYRMDIEPGEPVLDCHWHEEAEFFFVTEGEVLFQADADTFALRAGEAAFIDGGDIHAAYSLDGGGCKFYAIVFDVHLLDGLNYDAVQESAVVPLLERTRTFPRHIRPDSEWDKELLGHVQTIIRAYETASPGFEIAIKGRLYLMLHLLAAEEGRAANRRSSGSADSKMERLKKILLHMQEHYDRPIRISELASLIPMSESQFCRFFKRMTRQTPVEYLNAFRVKRAAELLRRTDRKISDIALEVGFDHISYFIRVFQRTMKATPSQYRSQTSA